MCGADMTEKLPRSYPGRPYVGIGIVVFRGDEVLLAQRGKSPRRYTWSIPGGAQDVGETVHEAAHRELMEETGLTVEILGLVDVVDAITRDDDGKVRFHYTLIDFAAEWKSGDAVADDDVAAVCWVKIADIAAYGLRDSTLKVIRRGEEIRNRL